MSAVAPGRPRDELIRKKILDTALKLALGSGYQSVTLLQIAETAQVSRPTIYKWWQSKLAIYLELIDREINRQVNTPSVSQYDALFSYLLANYALLNGPFGSLCADVLADVSRQQDEYGKIYTLYITSRRQYVEQLIGALSREQAHPPEISLPILTEMVIGIMWYRLIHRKADLPVDVARNVYAIVLKALDANYNAVVKN